MTPMFVLISQQTPRPNPQIYQGAAIAMIVWSWIYNYLCNQCLSPLMLWVWISIRVRCTTSYDKVCQWLALGWWFSPGPPVSSTNKTDIHDITEILLKVALNTIKQTNKYTNFLICIQIVTYLSNLSPRLSDESCSQTLYISSTSSFLLYPVLNNGFSHLQR